MHCAVYARKSTAETGMNDEEKSVTRQVEHAKLYAAKKGWTVSEEHVYSDDGISGAEFLKRPGFIRLMNALKPRPALHFLVMSEESRLGREQIETAYALKQIMDAGVRVFFYLEDRERTLDSALDKMMLSLTGFASEMERERTSQRVHGRLLQKTRAGHVVGGKVFGYDNVDVPGPDGTRQHVVRRINHVERDIILRIFEMYSADGSGMHTIAKALNADGIPPPRGSRRGWAGSCVRAILLRPLYRGVVVWNKTQAIHRGGTQTSRKRPQSEWETIEAPDLRIVPPDLAERVEAKFARTCPVCPHPKRAAREPSVRGRPAVPIPVEWLGAVRYLRRVDRLPVATQGVWEEHLYVRLLPRARADCLHQRHAGQAGHHGFGHSARLEPRTR